MNDQSGANVPASIFRAYDIRGVVDDTLTEETVEWIGRAVGSEAAARGQQCVIVARDGRHSGPRLQAALIRGLRASGRDVIDIGRVPTPVLYFATATLDESRSGVMVTGSHNPPDYNGFKIVLDGVAISGDAITGLLERIRSGDLSEGEGTLTQIDVGEAYLQRILGDVTLDQSQRGRPLKVVVDCGNGVAGELGPRLIEALGAETIPLFAEIDGDFPNHHPDPGKPENLVDLIAKVKETGADIGLAFDGDGDRLGVVTPSGEMIYPDRLLMAFATDLLERDPGARIVFDIKCTGNLAQIIERAGGEPEMWRTGHSLIKARMKETGAQLGGEMSGHIFFADRYFGYDDALYAAVRLLRVVARTGESLTALRRRLPKVVNTPELRFDCADTRKFTVIEEVKMRLEAAGAEVNDIDGVRVLTPEGWWLLRASNTQAALVARCEAGDEVGLEHLKADLVEQLRKSSVQPPRF